MIYQNYRYLSHLCRRSGASKLSPQWLSDLKKPVWNNKQVKLPSLAYLYVPAKPGVSAFLSIWITISLAYLYVLNNRVFEHFLQFRYTKSMECAPTVDPTEGLVQLMSRETS